jgi:hypothetical protein
MGAWLALAALGAAVAGLLWIVTAMPGRSWSGALPPPAPEVHALRERLRAHVEAIASRERNMWNLAELDAAARYIEDRLRGAGYAVRREEYDAGIAKARNLIADLPGADRRDELVAIAAHYDSVRGAPGANDNGSGVAAVLEIARLARAHSPRRTWRFALFVNEEPPFFKSGLMGSRVHVERARARGERFVAMYSLETIGYYADAPGSQAYPAPLGLFYPDRGDFVAFVANFASRGLLHASLAKFRAHAQFPSEGIAAPAIIPGVDWSDHWTFWDAGLPAVMITDTAPYRYPHYHTARDTPDKVDYDRLARVTVGIERMLRALDAEL